VTLDAKNVRTLVLVTWSGFLAWLWLTGETLRYLGPRTQWLVPFGAVALAGAAFVYARGPRRAEPPARLSLREAAGYGALVLPLVTGLLLANTQLGSLAASKKLTARGIDPSALAELASRDASQLSFLQVRVAAEDGGFANEFGIHPGRAVRLLGFVSKPPKHAGAPFELARFYITCCVADSVPVGVTIEPADPRPPPVARDDWLTASGELVRRGKTLRLRATRLERVNPPPHPYLSFGS
jgi:putative membrane protein